MCNSDQSHWIQQNTCITLIKHRNTKTLTCIICGVVGILVMILNQKPLQAQKAIGIEDLQKKDSCLDGSALTIKKIK